MEKRRAYGALSFMLVMCSFILIVLGSLWLFNGLGGKNSTLVLKGSFTLFLGLGIGAIANYL